VTWVSPDFPDPLGGLIEVLQQTLPVMKASKHVCHHCSPPDFWGKWGGQGGHRNQQPCCHTPDQSKLHPDTHLGSGSAQTGAWTRCAPLKGSCSPWSCAAAVVPGWSRSQSCRGTHTWPSQPWGWQSAGKRSQRHCVL